MKIIKLLKEAKKLYLEQLKRGSYTGMCWAIKVAANSNKSQTEQIKKGQPPYNVIVAQIPEFNPVYLGSTKLDFFEKHAALQVGLEFWWNIIDSDSRVKAFDKLIKLYEGSDKEFIW